jgi:hypothetical protein
MNFHVKAVSAAALCAIVAISTVVLAQVPVKPHPTKAAPISPLRESIVVTTFTISSPVAVVPKKPVVFTAVAPKGPIPSGNSALNPQPIPPGHGPADPVR